MKKYTIITLLLCQLFCLSGLCSSSGNNTQTATGATKNGGKTPLYIGGFFPYDETIYVTAGMPRVAQTAVDHINNMPFLLQDYELRLRWGYTKVRSNGNIIPNLFVTSWRKPD